MASQTLVQRIQLQGSEEILAQLRKMGAEGEKAIKQISAASNALSARGGFLSGFSTAVAGVRRNLVAFGTGFRDVSHAGKEFADSVDKSVKRVTILTAAVGGAVAGLFELAKSAGDNAREIEDQARTFGVSSTAMQHYQDVAKVAGVDMGALTKILLKFDTGLAKAGAGAAAAANPLGDFAKNVVTLGGATSQFAAGTTSIVRGLDDTKKAAIATGNALLDGLVSKTEEGRLVEFSHKLAAIQDPLKKMAALTQGDLFDKRTVVQTLLFLAQFEKGTKHLLPGLVDLQVETGVELAGAFAALSINLRRLKDGLLITFAGPALIDGLAQFGDFLIANQKKIQDFAAGIRDAAVPIVKDLFNALTGNDAEVQDKGIIAFRDAIIGLGIAAKLAFTGIIIPALKLVRDAAGGLATVINGVLGTKLSGDALIIAAGILAVTRAFGILVATLGLLRGGLLVATALFGTVGAAIRVLAVVATGLATSFGIIPVAIAAAIGAAAAAVVIFWPQIVSGAKAAASAVAKAFGRIASDLAGLPAQIAQQFGDMFARLSSGAEEAVNQLVGFFESLPGRIGSALAGVPDAITGAFTSAVTGVENAFNGLVNFVQNIATTISNIVRSILSSINSATQASGVLGARAGNAGVPGLASGGAVRGPGTGTSDSILARLSNGEFVQRASAVRYYGLDFMRAINALRLPRDAFRGFSMGGLVDSISSGLDVPRFAAGGLAAIGPGMSGQPLHLHLPGGDVISGLVATEPAVPQILRHVAERKLRQAGRAPGWRGSR